MSARLACGLAALCAVSGAMGAEPSTDMGTPLLLVDTGGGSPRTGAEILAAALGAPLVRGTALAERLGLLLELPSASTPERKASLEEAMDHFFAGRFQSAGTLLEALVREIEAAPAVFAVEPDLRRVACIARLYQAMIAARENDRPRSDRIIEETAVRYPDVEISAVEFPPWVREGFSKARESAHTSGTRVTFRSESSCEILVDGRRLADREPSLELARGEHVAEARPRGSDTGVLRRIVVGEEPETFSLLCLPRGSLAIQGSDLVYAASGPVPEDAVVTMALATARTGSWSRFVVAIGRAGGMDVLLVDTAAGGVVRRASAPADRTAEMERAAAMIAGRAEPMSVLPEAPRWYEDGLAWGFVAGGVAAFCAGLAVGQAYGTPSEEEAWAWSLMAAGPGLVLTGALLFFLPPGPESDDGPGLSSERPE